MVSLAKGSEGRNDEIGPSGTSGSDSRLPVTHGKDAALARTVEQAAKSGRHEEARILEPKSLGRKAVFRPILTSPFAVDWPPVNSADVSAIFHSLLALLGVPSIKQEHVRRNDDSPRNSSARTKQKNLRRKARLLLASLHRHGITPKVTPRQAGKGTKADRGGGQTSGSSSGVICGLNSVTRLLEERVSEQISRAQQQPSSAEMTHWPEMIFVCQADISPPTLVSHLPLLVATYNSVCNQAAYLIRLPPGSQGLLSDAVNLRRCGILSLDARNVRRTNDPAVVNAMEELQQKLVDTKIPRMHSDWLQQAAQAVRHSRSPDRTPSLSLLPPHIKHLRSSAPVDVHAVKAAKRARRMQRKGVQTNRSARSGARG